MLTITDGAWLPALVAQLVAAAGRLPASRLEKNVVGALLRLVDKTKPLGNVWAAKETLAEMAGYSVRATYGALAALEDRGWVERVEQRRTGRFGQFMQGELRITAVLVEALGFTMEAGSVNKPMPSAKNAGSEESFSEVHSSRQTPSGAAVVDKSIGKAKTGSEATKPGMVRVEGRLVPVELEVLATKVGPVGVFSMMKLLRQQGQGQRLVDVWWAMKDFVMGLPGRRALAYLMEAIRSGINRDWKWLRKKAVVVSEEEQQQADREAAFRLQVNRVAGRKFVRLTGQDAGMTVEVDNRSVDGEVRVFEGRKGKVAVWFPKREGGRWACLLESLCIGGAWG